MPPKNSIKIAVLIGMVGIFLSRILGFVRNMLIAKIFMGMESDAFYAAFKIPDVMFSLLLGGTLSTAFIPIFSSYLAKNKEEEGWKVASNFINIIMIAVLIFTVLGMIYAPYVVPLVAYNFKGEILELTIKLTRIMFPAVAFTCLAALQTGMLQTYYKFGIAALGPISYNIGIILSLLILGDRFGIEGIAYGVIISAFLNFLVQYIGVPQKKLYSLIVDPKQEGFRKIITLAIPTIISLSIVNLNEIITQNIASFLPRGSITELTNATSIMWLPIGIFATAITNAVFPTLAKQMTLNETELFKETFSKGLRTIFFVTIPSAVGLMLLSEPIVRLLFVFKNGQFGENHVIETAGALAYLSLGIAFQSGIQLLMRGFYSVRDTTTPLKVGVFTIITNVTLNMLFVFVFKLGIYGLALSTSITYILNMLILWFIFNKNVKGVDTLRVLKGVAKTTVSSLAMGAVIYYCLHTIAFDIYSKTGQIIEVVVLMGVGVLVFGVFALLLKMEEAQYFLSMIKNKLNLFSEKSA